MGRGSRQSEHGHTPTEIDERLAKAGKISSVRDFVYGAVDGTITTFAIVSGVAGAGLSQKVIVILGLANVLADGFSMASSNYLATRSEQDNHRLILAREHRHLTQFPDGEKAELKAILSKHGLSGEALAKGVDIITQCKPLWINLMLAGEYGISPSEPRPLTSAAATFVAFVLCGLLPMLPFILGLQNAYAMAALVTAVTFVGIGALKSLWSTDGWLTSALQTLAIGSCAALIAYGAGAVVSDFNLHAS